MSINFVNNSSIGSYSNISSSGTATLSYTGSANSALFALVSYVDGNAVGGGLSNVSDGVNTWNRATLGGDSKGQNNHTSAAIYSAYNTVGGGITLTMTNTTTAGSAGYWKAIILEFSGVLASAANDTAGNANNNGNSVGPVTCNGGVLSTYGELALVVAAANSGVTFTNPSSWTSEGTGGSFPAYAFAYYLPGSTTALSPSFGTISAANWAIAMSSYMPAVVASPTTYAISEEVWL